MTRVLSASVQVGSDTIAAIGPGLLVLLGATHGDDASTATALARTIGTLRILPGDRSVADTGAPVLVVSQFTLYGDTSHGRRPSWQAAAPAAVAEPLIDHLVQALRADGVEVAAGRFGAHMQVTSINDGPLTLILDVD